MLMSCARQGFQLVVPSAKAAAAAAAPVVGRAVFAQRAVQEQREEYLLSIGRIFHRVLLCGSAINVTHYRPRYTLHRAHPALRLLSTSCGSWRVFIL